MGVVGLLKKPLYVIARSGLCDEAIYNLLIYIETRLLHFVRNDGNPSFSTAPLSLCSYVPLCSQRKEIERW